ncbi:MAG: hypothetical protein RR846_01130 [Oscillospiraceae bacterium]
MKIDSVNLQSSIADIIKQNSKNIPTPSTKKAPPMPKEEEPRYDSVSFGSEKSDMFSDITKADELAKKYARGDVLTEAELKFLEEKNPELFRQAVNAKKHATELKRQMRAAKTPQQARDIALSASGMAFSMAKYNPGQAAIYLEAINKAISDYNSGKQDGEDGGSEIIALAGKLK